MSEDNLHKGLISYDELVEVWDAVKNPSYEACYSACVDILRRRMLSWNQKDALWKKIITVYIDFAYPNGDEEDEDNRTSLDDALVYLTIEVAVDALNDSQAKDDEISSLFISVVDYVYETFDHKCLRGYDIDIKTYILSRLFNSYDKYINLQLTLAYMRSSGHKFAMLIDQEDLVKLEAELAHNENDEKDYLAAGYLIEYALSRDVYNLDVINLLYKYKIDPPCVASLVNTKHAVRNIILCRDMFELDVSDSTLHDASKVAIKSSNVEVFKFLINDLGAKIDKSIMASASANRKIYAALIEIINRRNTATTGTLLRRRTGSLQWAAGIAADPYDPATERLSQYNEVFVQEKYKNGIRSIEADNPSFMWTVVRMLHLDPASPEGEKIIIKLIVGLIVKDFKECCKQLLQSICFKNPIEAFISIIEQQYNGDIPPLDRYIYWFNYMCEIYPPKQFLAGSFEFLAVVADFYSDILGQKKHTDIINALRPFIDAVKSQLNKYNYELPDIDVSGSHLRRAIARELDM